MENDMRMDRLSTWDEVRCALSRPIRSGAQPFFTCGTKFAIVPEFSDLYIRHPCQRGGVVRARQQNAGPYLELIALLDLKDWIFLY